MQVFSWMKYLHCANFVSNQTKNFDSQLCALCISDKNDLTWILIPGIKVQRSWLLFALAETIGTEPERFPVSDTSGTEQILQIFPLVEQLSYVFLGVFTRNRHQHLMYKKIFAGGCCSIRAMPLQTTFSTTGFLML